MSPINRIIVQNKATICVDNYGWPWYWLPSLYSQIATDDVRDDSDPHHEGVFLLTKLLHRCHGVAPWWPTWAAMASESDDQAAQLDVFLGQVMAEVETQELPSHQTMSHIGAMASRQTGTTNVGCPATTLHGCSSKVYSELQLALENQWLVSYGNIGMAHVLDSPIGCSDSKPSLPTVNHH